MSTMNQPFRVAVDGTITLGIVVPPRTGARLVAAATVRARGGLFRRNSGVPADVWLGHRQTDILGATLPHDCGNHLTADNE